MNDIEFPYLERFSRATGISAANLVQAFRIEREFHTQILNERFFEKRLEL